MERHVLVVLAHPDDETFGCGGTIALYTRAGTPVTYVCATCGEMGRRMGTPPFATRESLRHLREQELHAACAALGVADLQLLRIWDKTVEFYDPELLAQRVAAIVAKVQPTLVITFDPVHGGHPDHNAIGAATVRAVAGVAAAERPRLLRLVGFGRSLALSQGEVVASHTIVDIRPVSTVKAAAIAAHRSQSDGMMESMRRQMGDDEVWRKRMERWRSQELFEIDPL